jgi:hypothetical protein
MKLRSAVALALVASVAAIGGGWKWSGTLGVGKASAEDTTAVLVAPDGWSWGDGLPEGWSWGDNASAVPVQLDTDPSVDASLAAPAGWSGVAPDGWSWGGDE